MEKLEIKDKDHCGDNMEGKEKWSIRIYFQNVNRLSCKEEKVCIHGKNERLWCWYMGLDWN